MEAYILSKAINLLQPLCTSARTSVDPYKGYVDTGGEEQENKENMVPKQERRRKIMEKNFEEFSQSEKMAAQQKQIRIGEKEKGKEI